MKSMSAASHNGGQKSQNLHCEDITLGILATLYFNIFALNVVACSLILLFDEHKIGQSTMLASP